MFATAGSQRHVCARRLQLGTTYTDFVKVIVSAFEFPLQTGVGSGSGAGQARHNQANVRNIRYIENGEVKAISDTLTLTLALNFARGRLAAEVASNRWGIFPIMLELVYAVPDGQGAANALQLFPDKPIADTVTGLLALNSYEGKDSEVIYF